MPLRAHIVKIEVVEEGDERFVVESYDDGMVIRRKVDADGLPRRKPRNPIARAWTLQDKTPSAPDR